MRFRLPGVAVIVVGTLLLGASLGLGGCGTTSPTDSLASDASASSSTDTTSASLLAPGYLNDVVGVAQIGSAYIAPKEVIMSDAVEGYVPPLAFPVYRTVPEGPVTREAMDALADRLGVGPERTYYDSTALSDPRWNLTFHHGDIACFTLNNLRFDQEIMKQLEAGRMIKPVSPDSARKSADEILAASGYAEGVEFADTGVRTSVTGPFAGRPSSTYVLAVTSATGRRWAASGLSMLA